MQIIKYEHSCLDIQEKSDRLVVDPGVLSRSLTNLSSIKALVITHVHPDHFDEQKVRTIIDVNPDIHVFSTGEVAQKLTYISVTVPDLNKVYKVGDISLEFFGQKHAMILPSLPLIENFGVLVNDKLYYTGDSFTPCPKPHVTLGITTSAPWMKISETADFIRSDSATRVFPCHDGFLNNDGRNLVNGLVRTVVEASGKEYLILDQDTALDL